MTPGQWTESDSRAGMEPEHEVRTQSGGEMPVANRRFEIFEYRQVLTRMRLGDTDRAIARVGLMGRRKVAQLRRTAEAAGWLDVATPLPGDPELGVHLGSVRTQPAVASLAEPHRERITRWWRQGIQGTTIHAALVRSHGFTGSYSSVRRFLAGVEAAHPQVTTVLEFDPGEAAQVDFGKGPEVLDPRTGELLSTWIFVMTLTWSRHAYAEVVTDQKVATWLGWRRRARTSCRRSGGSPCSGSSSAPPRGWSVPA